MSKRIHLHTLGRELLSWGSDVCGCGHSSTAHRKKCTGLTGQNFRHLCTCKKYRPKDNLIFLEKKYEELVKKNER